MQLMKKGFAFVLCVMMAFLLFVYAPVTVRGSNSKQGQTPVTAKAEMLYQAGTYEAEAQGHNGLVKVKVTVSDSAITGIEVTKHGESAGISDAAIERIPTRIKEKQSLAIDTVSGATVTSTAILTAVEKCMKKADADISKLKVAVEETSVSPKELVEKESEVVVIGGGGAGLAAALSAAENGTTVILIEKTSHFGGNTILAGGGYNAVDPKLQASETTTPAQMATIDALLSVEPKNDTHESLIETVRQQFEDHKANGYEGLFDSIEFHALQTYAAGDYEAYPELLLALTERAAASLSYLEERGLIWKDHVLTYLGAMWPRSHEARDYKSGIGYVKVFEDTIKSKNYPVEFLMETKAEELITDNGKVVGVKAVGVDGTPYVIKAGKGIVLATGGFSANVEMRMAYNKQWPNVDATIPTTNAPSITGDGIIMAEAIGADTVGMEYIQFLFGDVNTGSLAGYVGQGTSLMINKEGRRFVNELDRRDVVIKATMEQPESLMYLLTNEKNSHLDENGLNDHGQSIDSLLESGSVVKGETLEELAGKLGMDPNLLQTEVDHFNEACRTGKDEEFGRNAFADNVTLFDGPYYATPRKPAVHHTMGGLHVDVNMHVLDKQGNVISGLYAAGEVTGGIHGTNRVGANAIPDALCNGRVAGEMAAAAE